MQHGAFERLAKTLADRTYVALVILTRAAGVLFIAQPLLPWTRDLSSRMDWAALAASFIAALALVVLLLVNLDDKWAYYRASKYLLIIISMSQGTVTG